jgi:hypothetical protein
VARFQTVGGHQAPPGRFMLRDSFRMFSGGHRVQSAATATPNDSRWVVPLVVSGTLAEADHD